MMYAGRTLRIFALGSVLTIAANDKTEFRRNEDNTRLFIFYRLIFMRLFFFFFYDDFEFYQQTFAMFIFLKILHINVDSIVLLITERF